MKILLIRPHWYFHESEVTQSPYEPIALQHLVNYVKDRHDVSIYDAIIGDKFPNIHTEIYSPEGLRTQLIRFGDPPQKIQSTLKKYGPDVVGITAPFFTQSRSTTEMIRLVRESLPDSIIVVGGSYPSSAMISFLEENPEVDVLVYGEGEQTFQELCDNGFHELSAVNGIIYRKADGSIKANPPRDLIQDIDTMPFPDREITPYWKYQVVTGPFFRDIQIDLNRIRYGKVLSRLTGKEKIILPKNNAIAYLFSNPLFFPIQHRLVSYITKGRIREI